MIGWYRSNRTDMKRTLWSLIAVIPCSVLCASLLFAAATDDFASNLRCGARIVSLGDTKSKVRDRCSEPSTVEAWEEELIRRDFYKPIPAEKETDLYREPFLVKEKILIEEWEYNFGPTRFIYYLRFENGKLKQITIGDYGY